MAVSKYDIKFYLTSVEPGIPQTSYSQSIGGYSAAIPTDPTQSLVYPEIPAAANLPLYATSLNVGSASLSAYLGADGEVIQPTGVVGSTATLVRGVNGIQKAHLSGDTIQLLSSNLFNNNFNDSSKQYRCLAVRNNNNSGSATNVQVFIKQQSRNLGSAVRIAIEIPQSDYTGGYASANGANQRQVISSSLEGAFPDNHFASAFLRFTSGRNLNQGRIISSFDSATGTLVVDSDLPFIPLTGESFVIDPAPAQRISTGIATPTFGTSHVSPLSLAPLSSPININVNGNRDHGNSFQPYDVFYVWIERTLDKDAVSFSNNNAVISLLF